MLKRKKNDANIPVPAEFKEAERMAKEANEWLLKGEIRLADSMIRRSIQLYPTTGVFEYALNLGNLPDMVTCTTIMELVIRSVENSNNTKISYRVVGDNTNDISEDFRSVVHYLFLQGANAVYSSLGERKWILSSMSKLADYDMEKMREQAGSVPLGITIFHSDLKFHYLLLQEKYDEALRMIDNMKDMAAEGMKPFWRAELYFHKKESKNLEKVLREANFYDSKIGLWYRFQIEIIEKNFEKARSIYGKLEKKDKLEYDYYIGLVDLYEGKYREAITKLEYSIEKQNSERLKAFNSVYKWKKYKEIGDAYAGLKDYQKATDNYNIALLYNPDYEPAIAAITKLETDYAVQSSTDKIAPDISLIDPSPQRGLIIHSAEANSTIKGLAADPSGIREVTINGQKVYSQPDGNFWGEIALTEGLNKITIVAIDKRGNKREQDFEIIKKATATANTEFAVKQGLNYALLLAAQNYSDNKIPSLENPVADAVKLKLILKNSYNFDESNIITLFNPEKNDIKRQLLELTNIIKPEDNLVIFYAGHGIWVDKDKKGYWMLIDSKLDDANTWLPNKDVLDLIAKLPARHTLLITDACFSGSVFKTRGLELRKKDETNPSMVQQMNEKISRVAITSGNDTEVPDKSVFMKYLVKALSENKDKYLTAQKMFITQIIEAVMTETKTEPRYGTLELAGHVGGDFIFIKK
ncbi:MAG: caspase family protein [Bacteroidota bacterium]|nr:caspase family protein [Bacteroidota bacterium]